MQVMPWLPSFISEAANRGHGTERAPTKITLMAQADKMFQMLKEGRTDEEAWTLVERQLTDHSFMAASEAKDLCAFVAAWGASGVDAPFLK